jgi:hypothetical protein
MSRMLPCWEPSSYSPNAMSLYLIEATRHGYSFEATRVMAPQDLWHLGWILPTLMFLYADDAEEC